jgi:hypothetical protein
MQLLYTPDCELRASQKELVLIKAALAAYIASADLCPECKGAFQDLLDDVQCMTSN